MATPLLQALWLYEGLQGRICASLWESVLIFKRPPRWGCAFSVLISKEGEYEIGILKLWVCVVQRHTFMLCYEELGSRIVQDSLLRTSVSDSADWDWTSKSKCLGKPRCRESPFLEWSVVEQSWLFISLISLCWSQNELWTCLHFYISMIPAPILVHRRLQFHSGTFFLLCCYSQY